LNRNLQRYSKILIYFILPFLVAAGGVVWTSFRIGSPDAAIDTARQYLDKYLPGVQWELGKIMKVGEGLSKKWRLEFSGAKEDGRIIRANLLVDRWRPERLVGKFIMLFNPAQILDGSWETPSHLDRLSERIPAMALLLSGVIFFVLQCFWLYKMRRRGKFYRWDGILLTFLGLGLLLDQLILEVHPAYIATYALALSFVGWTGFPGDKAHA